MPRYQADESCSKSKAIIEDSDEEAAADEAPASPAASAGPAAEGAEQDREDEEMKSPSP